MLILKVWQQTQILFRPLHVLHLKDEVNSKTSLWRWTTNDDILVDSVSWGWGGFGGLVVSCRGGLSSSGAVIHFLGELTKTWESACSLSSMVKQSPPVTSPASFYHSAIGFRCLDSSSHSQVSWLSPYPAPLRGILGVLSTSVTATPPHSP